jgi:hypothetical protein
MPGRGRWTDRHRPRRDRGKASKTRCNATWQKGRDLPTGQPLGSCVMGFVTIRNSKLNFVMVGFAFCDGFHVVSVISVMINIC